MKPKRSKKHHRRFLKKVETSPLQILLRRRCQGFSICFSMFFSFFPMFFSGFLLCFAMIFSLFRCFSSVLSSGASYGKRTGWDHHPPKHPKTRTPKKTTHSSAWMPRASSKKCFLWLFGAQNRRYDQDVVCGV